MTPEPELPLPATIGITDRESGVAKAVEAKTQLVRSTRASLGETFPFGIAEMTVLSLLTRAQAFHDGAIDAIKADNPFATFTLLRSYAENAAVMVWLLSKPADIARIYPAAPRDQRLSVGKLLNKANERLGGFKAIYEQLSGFAHPAANTALSGWHAAGEEMRVEWTSVPAFKNDDDVKMACFWLVELAQANAQLWRETWEMYFGRPPKAIPPEWTSAASTPHQ